MSDLKAARDWGLEHMPVFGRHLDNKMTATRQAPEELHQAIEDMNEAAQHINIRAMRAYILSLWGREAREANDWTRADEVYQKAITLYEEIDHQTDLFKMCMMRGNSASQLNHLSEARATYEQALALAERHRWYGREADVLWKLQDIVLQQGDLVTARSYFQRLLILENRTGTVIWGRTLYSLGNVAAQLGEIAQARDFYARAATSRFDEGRSLWSWGQMEYRLGDKKAGCALCQIALLLAEEASETTTLEAVVQEFNLWKLKYAGMDCEDA